MVWHNVWFLLLKKGLVAKTKKLYQKWLSTKRYEDKQAYLEIKRQTRRIIRAE